MINIIFIFKILHCEIYSQSSTAVGLSRSFLLSLQDSQTEKLFEQSNLFGMQIMAILILILPTIFAPVRTTFGFFASVGDSQFFGNFLQFKVIYSLKTMPFIALLTIFIFKLLSRSIFHGSRKMFQLIKRNIIYLLFRRKLPVIASLVSDIDVKTCRE